jgi:2-polyprenyl-3-methyl-5-hydroxy-6-metoxy-1,4-benzoquinol methylase
MTPAHADDAVSYFSRRALEFHDRYGRQPEFAERLRLWHEMLDRYVTRGGLTLDIGCGSGVLSFYLAQTHGQVVGVDGAPDMVAFCESQREQRGIQNVRFLESRLPALGELGSIAADLVVSSSVVEYVDDLDATLARFAQLLAPRGTLIISMPNVASLSRSYQRLKFTLTRTPEIYRYIRHFSSPRALHHRLQHYGFALLEVHYYTHVTRLARLGHALGLPPFLTEDLFVAALRRV